MKDLIVIGGGFWGTAIALVASESGLDVEILDSNDPRSASRNAAGIVCKHWYKQGTILGMTPADWVGHVDIGMEFLRRFSINRTGEEFFSYQNKNRRLREDCYLLDSPGSVLSAFPRTIVRCESIVEAKDHVRIATNLGQVVGNNVCVAAGALTDAILASSNLSTVGVRPLRGRAITANTSTLLDVPCTYMSRPYTHWTLRKWPGGRVRIGDTVEKRLDKQDTPLNEPRRLLSELCSDVANVIIVDGTRPVCDEFVVRKVSSRVIVATGGHRVGLALAGYVAERVAVLLGAKENPRLSTGGHQ